jgi:hypothetical protein
MDCLKIETNLQITTFTFYPKKFQTEEIKNYFNSCPELKNVYDGKDPNFLGRNITITCLCPKDIQDNLLEAVRTKNSTMFFMLASSEYLSVRLLCEAMLKHFDTTEMEIL